MADLNSKIKYSFCAFAFYFTFNCNAQTDSKKNDSLSQLNDYGARIYDTRLGSYMAIDPKQSEKNNPYKDDSKNVTTKNNDVFVNKKVKSK